ncbi:hypothetical protein DFH09DRAFT_1079850 [Mycena vulgaris]|nr:hypothetical protein DFH09DRAFT_1079850 [Mycena vulgaris]
MYPIWSFEVPSSPSMPWDLPVGVNSPELSKISQDAVPRPSVFNRQLRARRFNWWPKAVRTWDSSVRLDSPNQAQIPQPGAVYGGFRSGKSGHGGRVSVPWAPAPRLYLRSICDLKALVKDEKREKRKDIRWMEIEPRTRKRKPSISLRERTISEESTSLGPYLPRINFGRCSTNDVFDSPGGTVSVVQITPLGVMDCELRSTPRKYLIHQENSMGISGPGLGSDSTRRRNEINSNQGPERGVGGDSNNSVPFRGRDAVKRSAVSPPSDFILFSLRQNTLV